MGKDKSLMVVDGQAMIKHIYDQLAGSFDQILISANDVSKYEFLGAEVVCDKEVGLGPLMGILCGLEASDNDVNFVTACDIPEVNMALISQMLKEAKDFDAVIPKSSESRYEPLFAVYRKSVTGAIEQALESGNNKIMAAMSNCNVKYIDIDREVPKNINTMDEYENFIESHKS